MLDIKSASEAIKSRVRLGDVAARYTVLKRGSTTGEYIGLCPLHKEKSPSFRVNEHEGFYYCFGCKQSGDVFTLTQNKENLDFMGSLHFLANQHNVDLKEFEIKRSGETRDDDQIPNAAYERVIAALVETFRGTPESDQVCRTWFDNRKVPLPFFDLKQSGAFYVPKGGTMKVARAVGADQPGHTREAMLELGLLWVDPERPRPEPFCPYDERILLPVTRFGKIIAFTATILNRESGAARKYINSRNYRLFNKHSDVYGIDRARQLAKEHPELPLIVAEGAIDAEALLQSGFPAISCLGTALNEGVLSRLAVNFPAIAVVLDNDDAGRRGSFKLAQEVLSQNRAVRLSFLKAKEDPDELIARSGAQGVHELLEHPVEAVDYLIDHTVSGVLSTLGKSDRKNIALVKRTFLNEILPQLHDFESNPSHYAVVTRISERLSIEISVLTRMLHAGVKSAEKAIRTEVRNLPPSQLTQIHVRDRRLLALVKYHPRAYERVQREGLSPFLDPTVGALCETLYQHAQKPGADLREMLRARLDDAQLALALELYTLASKNFRDPNLELETLVLQYQAGSQQQQQVTGEQSLTAIYQLTGKYRDLVAGEGSRPLQVAAATALTRGNVKRVNLLGDLAREAAALPDAPLPSREPERAPARRSFLLEVEGAEGSAPTPAPAPASSTLPPPRPTEDRSAPAPWENDDATFL